MSKNRDIFGLLICLGISLGFMLLSESCVHWFMVPITLCGIILVKDAQDWLTGKLDIFNPIGIIAFLGFYFFYLAPILHVYWDSWMRYVMPPPDWRLWLGYMGILNLIGLTIYKRISGNPLVPHQTSLRGQWTLNEDRFWVVCCLALLGTMTLQIYVYQSFGGILGYIHTYEDQTDAFRGMGWIFMISESFPILSIMAYAVAARKNPTLRRWSVIILVIILFIGFRMLFGGMRGSRGNTIWALFWAIGIIHYWIRPLKRKIIIAGLIFLIVFMYSYGLYKSHGLIAFNALTNPLQRAELAEQGGRTMDRMLLGDLGRSDVQAYLLYCISDPNNQYGYKWGQTYLASLMLPIPKSMRPEGIGKMEAGTEAQYGYYSDIFLSSRIYGLTGEAMLNWGIVSVPFVFALFGLVVVKLRRFILNVPTSDTRVLLIPFIINICIIMLIGDSDNIVFSLIKNGSLPALVVLLSSQRSSTFPTDGKLREGTILQSESE